MVDARDGVAVEAILSIKEPTRIRIDGAPITDVFGNIHSSNCGAAAGVQRPVAAAAGIVARPSTRAARSCWSATATRARSTSGRWATRTKPVNLFISSAQATYTLVLRRADTPADTIVIRDRSQRQLPAGGAAPQGSGVSPPVLSVRPPTTSAP